ncbi:ferrochelatase [Lyngbya confervoides]|uniref:coproporphyrin ferrochelatase n=1 Tax=Lyngbya confervoides BDU141951 TaxID=1574623 RepID=A0ABD4T7N0_9CYAN|nr:ferrochelatase [Lyngbya confervoides]MCM1984551.1 ferrochelatase [Lyngbya confervoides BDU141951]
MVATTNHSHTHEASQTQTDRVAVLLMGYGEVEKYEDFATYNEQALNLLTAKFAPVPTWLYPPLAKLLAMFDLHEWGHQHHNFISPHNAIFERQRAGIEKTLQDRWGDRVQVFKAFNFCPPHLPHQVLQQIHDAGFQKVLIYPLLVVDSIFTSGIAVEQVNQALSQIQIGKETSQPWLQDLRYIPSFFNQPDYIHLLADLVRQEIQTTLASTYLPSQIGIVLMNHGCPHKAKGFVSGIEESEALYQQVREQLVNQYPLISIGWLNHDTPLIEWTQPNVYQAAKNLITLGAKAIVMMPIGFATENHETLLDVHHIIHRLEKSASDVQCIQMDCVNDHPAFLDMAANWAMPQIKSLFESSSDPSVAWGGAARTSHHAHAHPHA